MTSRLQFRYILESSLRPSRPVLSMKHGVLPVALHFQMTFECTFNARSIMMKARGVHPYAMIASVDCISANYLLE